MIQGGSRVNKDIPPYTLIGRDPIVYCGINIVGLRRRGFTNEQIFRINDIYRTLYQRGLNNSEAFRVIEEEDPPRATSVVLFSTLSAPQSVVLFVVRWTNRYHQYISDKLNPLHSHAEDLFGQAAGYSLCSAAQLDS